MDYKENPVFASSLIGGSYGRRDDGMGKPSRAPPSGEGPFAKQKVPVPQERVASLSMHLRTQLVANAGFITIMPNSMFQFNAKRWGLKTLPIDLGIKRRNVSIVTLKYRTLNSVVQVFIEHARLVSRQLRQEARDAFGACRCSR